MLRASFVLLLCLLLSGCGLKDIDKRFYVVTTGIDWTGKPDKPYRVSLRLAITSAKVESGSSKTQIVSIEAPSIAEGVRHLKSYVDKELEFGHCRIYILGKDLLEHAPPDTMSWFARRRDIQMVSYFAAGEPDALSVLKVTPESERYPGNSLFLSFGKEGTESPYITTTYLFDFARRRYEMGLDPVLPVIRTTEKTYEIDRVLLMDKKKSRLVLDPEETQLFNMTANKATKSELKMAGRKGKVVMTVNYIRTGIDIGKGSPPTVTLRVKVRGMLEESPPNLLEKDWKGVEKELAGIFSEQVEALLYKVRDAGVDPYGFGLHYLATYFGSREDYRHWLEMYPSVRFKVVAKVKVSGPGVTR